MICILILIVFLNSCNNAEQNTEIKDDTLIVNKSTKPKSFLIKLYSKGKNVSTATAVVIKFRNEEYLITNWHVITGRETNLSIKNEIPDTIKMFSKDYKGRLSLVMPMMKQSWNEFKDSNNVLFDLSAFKLVSGIPFDIEKLSIDSLQNGNKKDSCFIYAYPVSYLKTIDSYSSPKKISSSYLKDTVFEKKILARFKLSDVTLIAWNEKMENGISGAATYSSNSSFLGIYSTKLFIRTPNTSSNYGLFWNISAIKKLLLYGKPIDWSKVK